MAQYFDFSDLIEQYSVDFVAEIPSEGGKWNDKGDYVESEPQKTALHGAIIAHRESKVYKSNGAITTQDKALYMLEPLENSLQGAKVTHEGKRYSIGSLLENSEFTGVWAYNLQFVSAFGEVSENG